MSPSWKDTQITGFVKNLPLARDWEVTSAVQHEVDFYAFGNKTVLIFFGMYIRTTSYIIAFTVYMYTS